MPGLGPETRYFVPGALRDAATLLDEITERWAVYDPTLERHRLPKRQVERLVRKAHESEDPRAASGVHSAADGV